MTMILQQNPLIFKAEKLLGEPCRIELLKRMQTLSAERLLFVDIDLQERLLVDVDHQENHYTRPQDIERIIFDDPELARNLFKNIKAFLPEYIEQDQEKWQLLGLNERLRFYAIGKGQSIPKLKETGYQRSHREKSFFSLVFYLNDNFTGGESLFYPDEHNPEPNITIKPKTSQVVVFSHELFFAATPVTFGEKYVLRSDIIYRRVDN